MFKGHHELPLWAGLSIKCGGKEGSLVRKRALGKRKTEAMLKKKLV